MQALINVAVPVFGIIFCGYLAGRLRLLGEGSSEALNKFVFYVAMPPLLFLSMARVTPEEIFRWDFIGGYLGGQTIIFLMAWFATWLVFKRRPAERALAGMSAVFGNTGYMGIPLAMTAFGPEGMLPAVIATVIHSAVIIGVVAALVEVDLKASAGLFGILKDVVLALVSNPLFLGPVAGIFVSIMGWSLPAPIATFAELIGAAAGPCALFAIGLFLVGKPIGQGLPEVGVIVFLKLLLQPLIVFFIARTFLDLPPIWEAVMVLMAALPDGANVFVISQRYGVYVQRASAIILITMVFSILTVSWLLDFYGV